MPEWPSELTLSCRRKHVNRAAVTHVSRRGGWLGGSCRFGGAVDTGGHAVFVHPQQARLSGWLAASSPSQLPARPEAHQLVTVHRAADCAVSERPRKFINGPEQTLQSTQTSPDEGATRRHLCQVWSDRRVYPGPLYLKAPEQGVPLGCPGAPEVWSQKTRVLSQALMPTSHVTL